MVIDFSRPRAELGEEMEGRNWIRLPKRRRSCWNWGAQHYLAIFFAHHRVILQQGQHPRRGCQVAQFTRENRQAEQGVGIKDQYERSKINFQQQHGFLRLGRWQWQWGNAGVRRIFRRVIFLSHFNVETQSRVRLSFTLGIWPLSVHKSHCGIDRKKEQ